MKIRIQNAEITSPLSDLSRLSHFLLFGVFIRYLFSSLLSKLLFSVSHWNDVCDGEEGLERERMSFRNAK